LAHPEHTVRALCYSLTEKPKSAAGYRCSGRLARSAATAATTDAHDAHAARRCRRSPAQRKQLVLLLAQPSTRDKELDVELIQTHMAQRLLLWVEVSALELELELIQTLLWVEVGAHAVHKRSECTGVVWAGAGVAWRLCVCCLWSPFGLLGAVSLICVVPPRRGLCEKHR
jgi:hypothetical protein